MKKLIVLAGLSCLFWVAAAVAQDTETHFPLTSPDGRYVIKTDSQGEIKMRLIEKSSGKTLATLGRDDLGQWSVDEARWSPDSRTVAMTANRTKLTDLYLFRKDGNGFTALEAPDLPEGLFEKQMQHIPDLRHDGLYISLGKWRGNNQLELKIEQNAVDDNSSKELEFHKTVIMTAPDKGKPFIGSASAQPKDESGPTDNQLNEVYGRLRQKLSAAGKEHLKEDEKQWLTQRDQLTDAAEKQRFVEARIKELQKRLAELK